MSIRTIHTSGFSECEKAIHKLREKGLELICIVNEDAEFTLFTKQSYAPPKYVTQHVYGISSCQQACNTSNSELITIASDDSDFLLVFKEKSEESTVIQDIPDNLDDLAILCCTHFGK